MKPIREINGFWSPDVIVVEAADGDEGATPRRQLMGTVVPFSAGPGDHVGYTSVGPVRYLPGSLDAAARPAVDRDHDRTRLVGVVVDATADDQALLATVRLSATALGDETLALAADGVTTGFSATVRPTEYSFEDDDDHGTVLVVARGEWVGLAVTPDPAYDTARISKVAAARVDPDKQERKAMELTTLVALLVAAANDERRNELIGAHADVLAENNVTATDVRALAKAKLDAIEAANRPAPANVNELVETSARLVEEQRPAYRDRHLPAIEAAGVTGPQFDVMVADEVTRRTPPPQSLTVTAGDPAIRTRPRVSMQRWLELDFFAQAAAHGLGVGDPTARALLDGINRELRVEGALDEATTTTMVGIVPPQYTSDVLRGLPVATPLTNFCVRRGTLPAVGMQIVKPAWTVLPEGAFYTTENTEPASDAVAIGTRTVNVLNWAHAVKVSINAVERSTYGGFAANYYEQATISYLSDKEKEIADSMVDAILLHNGFVNTSSASTVKAKIALLAKTCITQQDDANGNFRGLTPDFAAVAEDVWEQLAGTDTDAGLAFGMGNVEIGGMAGQLGTLRVVLAPCLDAGGIIVGASAATEVLDGAELQLRQLIVNTMSYELGVHANCSIDVEYPGALAASGEVFS